MEQVGVISQWKTVFGWFRWANFKMIILGALITIKRSMLDAVRFASFPGMLFAAILLPFYAISAIWLKISPATLLVSALYVSRPFSDRIVRVLPKFLGLPTVALLMFLLFFASFVIPMIVIRASTERKDLAYLKKHIFSAAILWVPMLALNMGLAHLIAFIADRFVAAAWLWTYPIIPQIIEYIFSAWVLAFRLNLGFFYFDAVYPHGVLRALWHGIKGAARAAIYYLPILVIPWTALIAWFVHAVIWIIGVPMRLLPATSFSLGTVLAAASPVTQHVTLAIVPFIAIVIAALLNILNFSFYGTIFSKIKHQS